MVFVLSWQVTLALPQWGAAEFQTFAESFLPRVKMGLRQPRENGRNHSVSTQTEGKYAFPLSFHL